MIIKALSLHQPFASMVATGAKPIETRTRQTHYRGDLLIVSTLKPDMPGFLCGFALCIVEVTGCRKMTRADEKAARCKFRPGAWAWLLSNVRPIPPVRCRGYQGMYEVELELN